MPQKLKIEYVKQFVSEKSNGKSKVLDEFYINSTTPLRIECRCGCVFERKFAKIRNSTRPVVCNKCNSQITSENYRNNIDYVIEYINSTGCVYIDGEYKNNNSRLHIRCLCGNDMYKTFGKFKSGQQRCFECYRKQFAESKIKFSLEEAKMLLSEREYTMVDETEYKNGYTPVKCRCKNNHEFEVKISYLIRNQSGCAKCAQIKSRGKTNPHYIDGRSSVVDCLRDVCNTWKKKCKERYGNACAVTGEKPQRLVVHHLNSFSQIVAKASEETKVPVLKTIADYDDINDFYRLKDKVFELNQKEEGIPLAKKVHLEFHKKYGRENNTEKQFDEFLQLYYHTNLKDVRAKMVRKA